MFELLKKSVVLQYVNNTEEKKYSLTPSVPRRKNASKKYVVKIFKASTYNFQQLPRITPDRTLFLIHVLDVPLENIQHQTPDLEN